LKVANFVPVIADKDGKWPPMYLAAGEYKVELQDPEGIEIWTSYIVAGKITADF
jgi:hypothetical protein